MAGKAAEIIKYGEEGVSNGPAGDIQQASALARAMVMRWGMSDKVGAVDYAEAHEGYSGNTGGFSVSTKTKELIEQEVRDLIEEGYQHARQILLDKSDEFERLARGLLEYETLTGEEIGKVIRGEPLGGDDDTPSSAIPAVPAVPRIPPASGGPAPVPTA